MTKIAIIGAGFSGTLLALHLLRRCSPSTEIHLIERGSRFGRGAAYAIGNPRHLLNVPAGRMSAFHDRPRDFLDWLEDHSTSDQPITSTTFVPRQVFGTYVRDLLKQELRRPDNHGRLHLMRGDAAAISSGKTLTVSLDRDRQIDVDLVVLAIGNFPPEPPPGIGPNLLQSGFYRPDPWAPDTLAELDPDDAVLLIGTGLTTVDLTVALLDHGHRGPVHALSRRGLLPRRHGAGMVDPLRHHAFPTRLTALTRHIRNESRRATAAGGNWQQIVDELRPFTSDVWLAMSPEDRQRFLRHLRPWWDVHRHRIAPAVADRLEAALGNDILHIHAGRLQETTVNDHAVEIVFNRRFTGEAISLRVGRVINCSGPGADYDRIPHQLIHNLLAAGLVRPDPLRLGLDVTANCALKDRNGAISRRLFAIGPVTKGTFWEMTAVPDIRRQCELLASHLSLLSA